MGKHGNPQGNSWNDHPSCAFTKAGKKGRAADPSPQVQASAPKKRCIKNLSSGPLSPASRPALPTEPRATRSKPTRGTSETQPDSGIGSTRASSTSTQRASGPSTARGKATKPASGKKQRRATPNDNRKRTTQSKKASDTSGQTNARGFHIDESLPPLSDLNAIFHDMVSKACTKIPLEEALEHLSQKQVNVATMCSGTESPLLALSKIQNGKH